MSLFMKVLSEVNLSAGSKKKQRSLENLLFVHQLKAGQGFMDTIRFRLIMNDDPYAYGFQVV